jgi:FAD:protein FMN transferase
MSATMAANATVAATRARWQALGTSAELVVSDGDVLTRAQAIVEQELEKIDRTCSRFREDSDLTRVNAQAGRAIQVSPLLIEATELALRAADLTNGDVDPTIGVAIELAGYDRDWRLLARPPAERRSDVPSGVPAAMEAPRPGVGPHEDRPEGADALRVIATVRAGWERVELDRERATLKIPRGVKLDLGATAKAWAADRATRAVHEATGCGVLVSLGGDISTAGSAPAHGWAIHVTDDHRGGPDAPGQRISIAGGGVATSSTTVRRWRHDGRTMHHIIDPSTGEPVASPWRTVSVAAADCADANIAATAAIVRGERAPRWLAELGLPARLVARNGEVVAVGCWPREGELR